MKRFVKFWAFTLCVVMLLSAVACNGNDNVAETTASSTTEAIESTSSEETSTVTEVITSAMTETETSRETATETQNDTDTETETEAPDSSETTAESSEVTETTDENATDTTATLDTTTASESTTEEETEPEDVPYEVLQSPVITTADKKEIRGYNASGEFIFTGGDAQSTTGNNMFIVTNDRLPKGKITATFSAPEQHNNDNGIIFGMVEDTEKQYFFWEDGPTYYFLFVSDDATLYLAKVSYNGNPWTELQITAPIPYYAHGDVITISVEFDGEGFIDCYANGEWLISYYDEDWSGGDRYGIRCEVPEVCYNEVIVDYEYDPEW